MSSAKVLTCKWLESIFRPSINSFIQAYDQDGDGNISLDEFRDMVHDVVQKSSMFTGVQSNQLTAEQAVALLAFDWKSQESKLAKVGGIFSTTLVDLEGEEEEDEEEEEEEEEEESDVKTKVDDGTGADEGSSGLSDPNTAEEIGQGPDAAKDTGQGEGQDLKTADNLNKLIILRRTKKIPRQSLKIQMVVINCCFFYL
jgi:hypothetical protein